MREMFTFLKNLKGNPKCIFMVEPLWGAPFNMFAPFATLYMFALGLGDVDIGLLLSIGMFANFIMALLGGVLTDKFGRKRTLLIADFLCWSIPVLILAFAQNFWWFLASALFSSLVHIAVVAFECTWQDDTEESKLPKLVNWFHIFWLGAVFFALVSAYFVEHHDLVIVMRVIYLFAFISMSIRIVILTFTLKETERGKERMAATKNLSIIQQLSGYKEVFFQIMRTHRMRRMLIWMPMVNIFMMITGTFFALYATQNLEISDYFLAYFPVIRAGVSLLFFLFIQNRLMGYNPKYLMAVGLVLYVAGHILLLIAPPQNITWLWAYALVDAWAASLFLPRLDALLFGSIDPTERARCRSLINVVVLAATSPFGILAGFLSDMDRRLPFVLNMILFICLFFLILVPRRERLSNA